MQRDFNWGGGCSINGKPRAGYCTSLVLCPPGLHLNKPCLTTFVHEFGHALHFESLRHLDPTFEQRVKRAYENAMALDLWPLAVTRGNSTEYWAEGIELWFYEIGAGRQFQTHAAFAEHDPLLGEILSEWFPAVSLPLHYK